MGSIGKFSRATLGWGSLVFAAILLINGNFLAGEGLRAARVDLTEDSRFTISEGTRKTLEAIGEPIRVRVYFSRLFGESYPQYAQHFDRVRTLLGQYQEIAPSGLVIEYFDPEPFSAAEDLAVSDRVRGVPINTQGELAYFGIAMSNSVDERQVIPFLDLDRDQFLEYDLTSKIFNLSQAEKRVVGLITGFGIDGSVDPAAGVQQPLRIMAEMRQFFDVRLLTDINDIPSQLTDIPDDVDVLLLVQPLGLSEATIYAIDQFALRGGKVLAFLDPTSLTGAGIGYDEKLIPLLARWGIAIDRDHVAGDLASARRSETGDRSERVFSEFVASLQLGVDNIDQADVVAAGIEKLNLMTAGIVSHVAGAGTEVTDLLFTSPQSMAIEASKVRSHPDPVALLRKFQPSGERLALAARISGTAQTAYPDGAPPPPAPLPPRVGPSGVPIEREPVAVPATPRQHLASGDINAIVIADVDMLFDSYWVGMREFFGEQLLVPHASNAALLVSALENLSGDSSLIALRGRGIDDRPFELVEQLQVDAEQRFRETERGLDEELAQLEQRIAQMESAAGGAVILGEEDRGLVENFRRRSIEVRAELREVKLALRRDIDRVDQTLKAVNIGGVPALFALAGIGVALWRRGRSKSGGSAGRAGS